MKRADSEAACTSCLLVSVLASHMPEADILKLPYVLVDEVANMETTSDSSCNIETLGMQWFCLVGGVFNLFDLQGAILTSIDLSPRWSWPALILNLWLVYNKHLWSLPWFLQQIWARDLSAGGSPLPGPRWTESPQSLSRQDMEKSPTRQSECNLTRFSGVAHRGIHRNLHSAAQVSPWLHLREFFRRDQTWVTKQHDFSLISAAKLFMPQSYYIWQLSGVVR